MLFMEATRVKESRKCEEKRSTKLKIVYPYSYPEFLPYEHSIFWPTDVADDRLWRVFLRYEIID